MIAFTKIKKYVLPLVCIGINLYFIFKMPHSVTAGVTKGVQICFNTILPSLFPFMVISSYISKTDLLSPFYRFIAPVTKYLFRQPPHTLPLIILSMIGGFPVGIKNIANDYNDGKITQNQAQRLCMFCMNGGPAFVITAVGVNMLGNMTAGVIIYISLCISSLILGFLSSFFDDKKSTATTCSSFAQSPTIAISSAVIDSTHAMLGICAWIILFSGIAECIFALNLNNNIVIAITSVLEVTKGCSVTAGKFSLPIITAIIGFGGICVHCQILSFLQITKLKYIRFIVGRIINGALSAIICHLLLMAFPVDIQTSVNMGNMTISAFSVSIPAFLSLIVMCITMILDIDNRRKMC